MRLDVFRRRPVFWGLAALFGTWGVYFAYVWPRMLFRSPEGLVAGWVGVWADWAAHLSYASAFAYRPVGAWFSSHPLAYAQPFAYPFLADAISGLLMRAGVGVVPAFLLPSLVATVALLGTLFTFYRTWLRSSPQALLAVTLFLAGGGAGALWFLRDVAAQPTWATLFFPPREYTHMRDLGIEWVNVITAELIPQRAFLLGMPIGLGVLTALLRWARRGFAGVPTAALVGLGLLCSTLVIIHTHTWMALAMLVGVWSVLRWRWWRAWLLFGASAAVPSLLLAAWLTRGGIGPEFLQWRLGWMATAEATGLPLLTFWWRNWGFFLPLAAVAAWRVRDERRPLVVGAVVVFALSHLVLFQPFDWDNTKILTWSVLILVAPVAALVSDFTRRRPWGAVAALLSVVALSASGGLDLWRLTHTARLASVMSTPEEFALAEALRRIAGPTDLVLTADHHLHWVPMHAGRPIVLGYRGWLWTYGIETADLLDDVRHMYRGGPEAERLLRTYGVRFVVVGPREREAFPVEESFFRARYQAILETDTTRVYRVVHPERSRRVD